MRCADKKFSEIRGRGIEKALGLFVCWRCEGAGAFACVPPFFCFPSISFSLGTHAAGDCCVGIYAAARRAAAMDCKCRCNSGRRLTGSWPTTDF
nr:MAG TPA: hypothetical protein [Caudoviricetes sp.]